MNSKTRSMTRNKNLLLYNAITSDDYIKRSENVKSLLTEVTDINAPLIKNGPYSGSTALHAACIADDADIVEMLIKDYNADVNVTTDDGMQPIHFGCFFHQCTPDGHEPVRSTVEVLLEAKANADADLGKEIFKKYPHDLPVKWCPDFGDRIPLVMFIILYGLEDLVSVFHKFKAKMDIVSRTNKTLLMYAIERDLSWAASIIACSMKDSKLLNHRDNDGRAAVHYFFHPERYGKFRYDANETFGDWASEKFQVINYIINCGGDIYALVNNDPETFLLNMAAYRSDEASLVALLPFYRSITLSKALYLATIPVRKNSTNYLRLPREIVPFMNPVGDLPDLRERCTTWILKDLVNRKTFGLPIPEEEDKLMKKLVATDPKIRKIVKDYEKDFIDKGLKNLFIEIGGKKMTRYDFIMEAWNDRKLNRLARDKSLVDTWEDIFIKDIPYGDDYTYFSYSIRHRMDNAQARFKLMEELKMIEQLRDAIPLPFELIWEIVDYMSHDDLKIFIEAFKSS